MYKDLQSYEVSDAGREALEVYHSAVTAFSLYRGDPVGLLEKAVAIAPDFSLAYIAKIYMLALSTEPAAIREAGKLIPVVGGLKLNDREKSLHHAAATLVSGRWKDAGDALDRHTMAYPLDLLALQSGHLIDFYRADSRNLGGRIARALGEWDEAIPGYPVVLGMYAFGLEEYGQFGRAEEAGRKAIALEPFDSWAHHAVAHVLEMTGRPEDGIGWMIAREPFWSTGDNFFKVHNWWHRAVFHLDLQQNAEALALYDTAVRNESSPVALDLIDASALLWRLQLAGVEPGDRWCDLATAWEEHADGGTYPFNDWHAVMAFLGADRSGEAARLIRLMKSEADRSPVGDWIIRAGLPLVEGFTAYWHGDFQQAVDTLLPVHRFSDLFGGSHAQRDIIDLTLLEAACRGGMERIARSLVNERLAVKPHSRMNREFLRRLPGLPQGVEAGPTLQAVG